MVPNTILYVVARTLDGGAKVREGGRGEKDKGRERVEEQEREREGGRRQEAEVDEVLRMDGVMESQ